MAAIVPQNCSENPTSQSHRHASYLVLGCGFHVAASMSKDRFLGVQVGLLKLLLFFQHLAGRTLDFCTKNPVKNHEPVWFKVPTLPLALNFLLLTEWRPHAHRRR